MLLPSRPNRVTMQLETSGAIVLFGAGGHAREVAEIVMHSHREKQTPPLLGFLDQDESLWGSEVDGYPVLGNMEWYSEHVHQVSVIVAIGNIAVRKRISLEVEALGGTFGQAVSPLAHLSSRCRIGEGAMIFPQVMVSTNAAIGRHVILGVHSNVSHDSVVGDYSFLCPASTVTGGVHIGEEVMLGTGASVIPTRRVGDRAIIGAGACVVKDVPPGVTAVGVPAGWQG